MWKLPVLFLFAPIHLSNKETIVIYEHMHITKCKGPYCGSPACVSTGDHRHGDCV